MMSFPVALIIYWTEMLIACILFSSISEKKYSTLTVLGINALIAFFGAVINVAFSNTIAVNVPTAVLLHFAFAAICFRLSLRAAAAYSLIFVLFGVACEFVTILPISAISGTQVTAYNTSLTFLILDASSSKVLYFLVSLLLLRATRGLRLSENSFPPALLVLPVVSLLAFIALAYVFTNTQLNDQSLVMLAYVCLAILSTMLVIFIAYRHSAERSLQYAGAKAELEHLQSEKAYYDILEHQNQQLMIYAHDAKKHLSAIQALSDDPQISEYAQALTEQLQSYSRGCHSGNRTLDVVINRYVTECELKGIAFDYDVKLCNLGHMEDLDLVAVLGNLMDNAVAAAENSTAKRISLSTALQNSCSIVNLDNSCDTPPLSSRGTLLTRKEKPSLHGLGLKSVKQTLKKYHGDFSWDYDAGSREFKITLMIGKRSDAA